VHAALRGAGNRNTGRNVQVFVNDESRAIESGATIGDLLRALDLAERHVAVEVNLELVPRALHAERILAEGDRLEIVSLVGGG